MDLVIVSLVVILPVLVYSFRRVRAGDYAGHKRVQLILAGSLAVAVSLFEADMRQAGGIFELTKASRFAGTPFLNGSIYLHTFLSISTTLVWVGLIALSLRRFGKPPAPGAFSAKHRLWGRLGMILMALTGITGVELYVIGFAY
jgi:uncharacterized membrane protein YozB (DUF420 family)